MGSVGRYDPAPIEAEARRRWAEDRAFATPPPGDDGCFVYACTPFTTGNLHMGHVRSYTIADVWARRARSLGRPVLWAMGYDAFGLPNEIVAAERGLSPRIWVDRCIESMAGDFARLGISVDWQRCFDTSHPSYYRWTQLAFLKFLEMGLVRRAEGIENWCPSCAGVLAAQQVSEDGSCWRCGSVVELRSIAQWYLHFAPYAERLDADLDRLEGWDETVLAFQRSLLGRSEGREADALAPDGSRFPVFLPTGAEEAEAAFVAVSPNHDLARLAASSEAVAEELNRQRRRNVSRSQRGAFAHHALATDLRVRIGSVSLPLVISPAVDMAYGGGAMAGLPAEDPLAAAIAERLGLEARERVAGPRPARRYRLRDSSISRQRSWGAPVPVVHCPACGIVPVAEAELPVRLPDDLWPGGKAIALADHPDFAGCACPRCGGAARRDTDTLDVHFDSIWMLVPFCVPPERRDREMFTHPDLDRWLPVEQVVCGADQAGWWVNDRLFFKVMKDLGYFPSLVAGEPVRRLMMHEMVRSGGRKMSKSLGNAVDPLAILERWGADTLRLAVLAVNPRKAFDWSEGALEENHKFLSSLWALAARAAEPAEPADQAASGGGGDALARARRRLGRWLAAAEAGIDRAYAGGNFHLVLRESKTLLAMIGRFDSMAAATGADAAAYRHDLRSALLFLTDRIEPLAPHVAAALRDRLAPAAAEAAELRAAE